MQKLAFVVLAAVTLSPWTVPQESSQDPSRPASPKVDTAKTTTWFIVRHADRDGDADKLTDKGRVRARELATLMQGFRVAAVYSTPYQRTRDTARPAAQALKTNIVEYRPRVTDQWLNELKKKHAGQAVLIVGHSNTAGGVVRKLGGKGDYSIHHDEYDSLFIVTTTGANTSVVRVRFGDKSVIDKARSREMKLGSPGQ